MAEAQKVAVRPRTVLGKKVKRLRREGRLPGVVAGGHGDSIPVEVDTHGFQLGYRSWGTTTLLALEGLDGGDVPALVHGVTRDPRTGRLMHVDFARVSLTERTTAEVPLHFTGEPPAVKNGAVLVHALDHVRVEAFPQDMPHRIDADLTPLEQVDDSFYVRDLVIDAQTVRILNDPDELVAKAVALRVEAEPTPAAAETLEGAPEGEGEAEAETPAAEEGG